MRHTKDERSLKILKEWVQECLNSACRPLEIYTAVIDAVKENTKYHEICAAEGRTLVTMLTNNFSEVEKAEQ